MMRSTPKTWRLFTSATRTSSRPAPHAPGNILQDGMYVTIICSSYTKLTYFGLFRNVVKAVAHQGEKNPEANAETSAAEAAPEAVARDFSDLSECGLLNEDLVEHDLDLDPDLVERDFDECLYKREYVKGLYGRGFALDLIERDLFDLEERSFSDPD